LICDNQLLTRIIDYSSETTLLYKNFKSRQGIYEVGAIELSSTHYLNSYLHLINT